MYLPPPQKKNYTQFQALGFNVLYIENFDFILIKFNLENKSIFLLHDFLHEFSGKYNENQKKNKAF